MFDIWNFFKKDFPKIIKVDLKTKINLPIMIIIGIKVFLIWIIIFVSILNLLKNEYSKNLEILTQLKYEEISQFINKLDSYLSYFNLTSDLKYSLWDVFTNHDLLNTDNSKEYFVDIFVNYTKHNNDIKTLNFVDNKWYVFFSSDKNGINLNYKWKKLIDIFDVSDFSKTKQTYHIVYNRYYDRNDFILSDPIYKDSVFYWYVIIEAKNLLSVYTNWETYLVWTNNFIYFDVLDNQSNIRKLTNNFDTSNKCLTNKNETLSMNFYSDRKVLWISKYISKLDMCIVSEVELLEPYLYAKYIIYIYCLFSWVALLLIYLIINFLTWYIIDPLKKLEDASREIKNWNLNIDIEQVETNDELQPLTDSYIDMIKRLRNKDIEVKHQVLKQTNKIIKQNKDLKKLNVEFRKFQLAVDNASDYITILNTGFKTIYVNKSFERNLWYKTVDIIWKKNFSLFRKIKSGGSILNIFNIIKRSKKPFVEYFVLKNFKLWIDVVLKASITPILDENGYIKFYLIIEDDITKDIEIDNLKDEFISVASHELRTPMTVIKWYSWLLLDEKLWKLNDSQRKFLERIKINTSNLLNLVNEMLDIWKLESRDLKFNYEKFNIKEFFEEVVSEFYSIYEQKSINLLYKCDLDKEEFKSDKSKLKQVMINFIWNAYKYTESKWQVSVECKIEDNKLKVFVKDTWIWIPEQDIWKLFKKFSQVDSYLQKKIEWTWLWLAISKQIIEKLWWEIWVTSELRKWSTFYFYLPIVRE